MHRPLHIGENAWPTEVIGSATGPRRLAGSGRWAMVAGGLWLVALALVIAGCTGSLRIVPPGTTVIDFEDYPDACRQGERTIPLTDCYRARGVSIDGARVVDFSRRQTPSVTVGGTKAIESCPGGDQTCTGRLSMTFTTPVVRVAMKVGYSRNILETVNVNGCPLGEIPDGEIVLTAFADTRNIGRDSVRAYVDCVEDLPGFLGPLNKPGLDGRVEVRSSTGTITRVEVGWSNVDLTEPIIVDDLELQPVVSELTVIPATIDLGETTVLGTAARAETTVRNDGNIPVVVQAVQIGGANPGDFTLGGDCVGRTLGPGSSCWVVVTFAATEKGQRRATLVVVTATGVSRTAELTGTGVEPTPPPFPWAALVVGLVLLTLIALAILGLILLVRRLGRGPRTQAAATTPVPARVWVQPGPETDTIRMTGPSVAVGLVHDPAADTVTWTSGRKS